MIIEKYPQSFSYPLFASIQYNFPHEQTLTLKKKHNNDKKKLIK